MDALVGSGPAAQVTLGPRCGACVDFSRDGRRRRYSNDQAVERQVEGDLRL
jgi:hypothetical protein